MEDFVYEKEIAPCGVSVETIYGADDKSAKVWKLFALQIYSESGSDYRQIGHMENGAPLLDEVPKRISLTHTTHFLAVASLPKTPETELTEVSHRTSMGIDAEISNRRQVLNIKEKFLSAEELKLMPATGDENNASDADILAYILAWTCKEALYKADLGKATDWKEDYKIVRLPEIAKDIKQATPEKYGKGIISDPNLGNMEMTLSSWLCQGHVVTLAFSPKIARFS